MSNRGPTVQSVESYMRRWAIPIPPGGLRGDSCVYSFFAAQMHEEELRAAANLVCPVQVISYSEGATLEPATN